MCCDIGGEARAESHNVDKKRERRGGDNRDLRSDSYVIRMAEYLFHPLLFFHIEKQRYISLVSEIIEICFCCCYSICVQYQVFLVDSESFWTSTSPCLTWKFC